LSASHATADRHRGGQVDEEGADAAASQRGVARRRQDVTAAGTCWGRAEAVLDGGVPAAPRVWTADVHGGAPAAARRGTRCRR